VSGEKRRMTSSVGRALRRLQEADQLLKAGRHISVFTLEARFIKGGAIFLVGDARRGYIGWPLRQ